RSGGNTIVKIARVCGISTAAPSPWTARKAISHPGPGARPQAAEAAGNSATPMMNMTRWPIRSPSRPAVISRTARTSPYPSQRPHQRVRVDYPENVVERCVQPRDHVGDRDVDDRQVEQGHEEPERDDEQHGPWVAAVLLHNFSLASPPPERPA